MKLLHVINSLGTGGAEKLLQESIPLYNKLGIKTDLLLLNGTEHSFLKTFKKLSPDNLFSPGNTSVYNPLLIFKIIPFLKKYDIIHVHLFPSLYWVAFAKMFSFSNVKMVFTEHNTTNKRRSSFIFKIIDKIIYSYYSKIITISSEVDQNIKNHLKAKKEKFILIPNGINLDFIVQQMPYSKKDIVPNASDDSFLLIQVSSFRLQKDQKTLIKSLQYLEEDTFLLLVGEGVLENECKSLVEELNLKDRIFFLGVRMDVIQLLKSSDVVVLSSHYEGLSLSSIEGLASGKPFVASDAPGLSSVVSGAGLLFPIGDELALSQCINKLRNDKKFYQSTAEAGAIRASQYDIKHMVEKTVALYKSVLNVS
jgi:glycosyltransferase involved in cell wall biosynthesis